MIVAVRRAHRSITPQAYARCTYRPRITDFSEDRDIAGHDRRARRHRFDEGGRILHGLTAAGRSRRAGIRRPACGRRGNRAPQSDPRCRGRARENLVAVKGRRHAGSKPACGTFRRDPEQHVDPRDEYCRRGAAPSIRGCRDQSGRHSRLDVGAAQLRPDSHRATIIRSGETTVSPQLIATAAVSQVTRAARRRPASTCRIMTL